jgi:hypothetical protein
MKRQGKDGEEKSGERKGSGMKIRLSLRAGKDKDRDSVNSSPEVAASTSDRVLVHCMHGRSRSATVRQPILSFSLSLAYLRDERILTDVPSNVQIVLAYLMKKEGWTLREAYVHVKLRRPIVGPDKCVPIFLRSLARVRACSCLVESHTRATAADTSSTS